MRMILSSPISQWHLNFLWRWIVDTLQFIEFMTATAALKRADTELNLCNVLVFVTVLVFAKTADSSQDGRVNDTVLGFSLILLRDRVGSCQSLLISVSC